LDGEKNLGRTQDQNPGSEQNFDENLFCRIRGKDLFATEAKYHKSCRVQYTQNLEKWRSANTENKAKQIQLVEAHSEAFGAVSKLDGITMFM